MKVEILLSWYFLVWFLIGCVSGIISELRPPGLGLWAGFGLGLIQGVIAMGIGMIPLVIFAIVRETFR